MPGMEKVLKGVLRYRTGVKQQMLTQFKRVKENPEPIAVMFTCMDSRLHPSQIFKSNAGDMYMVRNAGNLIPHSRLFGSEGLNTEPAALHLTCITSGISNVVVCGHSDCKAMNALYDLKDKPAQGIESQPFGAWLRRFGSASLTKFERIEVGRKGPLTFQGETQKQSFEAYIDPENKFALVDKLSQVNCLQQLQNISSYSFMKGHLESDKVRLHAMWYDIHAGDVYLFSRKEKRFVDINETTYKELLHDCTGPQCQHEHHFVNKGKDSEPTSMQP